MPKRKRASHKTVISSSSDSGEDSSGDHRNSNKSSSSDSEPDIGPDATQEALYRALRKHQALVNEAQGEVKTMCRRFADVTNKERPHKGRKKHKKDHHAPASERELEETRVLGRKFAVTKSLWLRNKKHAFTTAIDDTYNPLERFDTDASKIQGQLVDLLETLPVPQRKMKDMERNGMADAILHKDFHGAFVIDIVFLNPKLHLVFGTIVRGVSAVPLLKAGKSPTVHAETNDQIWGLQHTTPGDIASSAIAARFAVSADDSLRENSTATGINWAADHEMYVKYLTTGIEKRKASVLKIFRVWNEIFFPG
ncbi:hypothetical protein C8R44DRAFT_877817 [Mycena epipterygia]|nr:hypothetical protein C8R44DRAFT_877817 [Mycena epipterygia]